MPPHSPGSKLDFFGWFKVEQGKDEGTISTVNKAPQKCTVQAAVKINNDVPPNGLIKYLRPKNAPELMTPMSSGGIFLFRDCPIPKDKTFEFELVLSDGSKPISAIAPFVEPDENGVSKLRELLFEGTYDSKTKKYTKISFSPSINIQTIQQVGEGNKASQE